MAYQIIFRVKDYFKNVLIFNQLQIFLKTGIILAQIKLISKGIVQRLPLLICRVPVPLYRGRDRRKKPVMPELMLAPGPEPSMVQGRQANSRVQTQEWDFEKAGIHAARTKARKRLEFQR